jgi:TonB-dependent receptor
VQASSRRFDARRFRYGLTGSADPAVLRLSMEQMLDASHVGPDFLLAEETLQGDTYDATLAVYAGYLLADWAATARLRVAAGVRYEAAVQELTPGSAFAVDFNRPDGVDRTDGELLPAANVTFAVRPDMNLRGAYSFTLARPQFRELAPFIYFDFARRRSVTGNPDLETTRIHNVDARWEWFLAGDEVLAATVFFKRFDSPIEQAVMSAAQGDLWYVNAPAATALGAELEARLALRRLAPALRSLRAAANVSFIRSEVDFGGREGLQTNDRRPMQGQSPFVLNASLTWDAPLGIEATALYNVFGRRLAEVGWERLPDTYEQAFHRVDLTLARELATSWKLKAAITNLLDEEVVLKQEDFVVLRYRPGVAGTVALEWSR